MGILDLFRKKTTEEKNKIYFEKLRKKTTLKESRSLMHEMIISTNHDPSLQDENPKGEGEFGLVKSNPIPIYGIDNLPFYMDKLRYEYTSKSGSGTITYNQVEFVRTSEGDQSKIGSKRPKTDPISSSISSPNIQGHIDVYNLYSIGGEKLNKIYVNCYSLKTSNKVPKGFFHRDEIPAEKDSKLLLEAMKNINK